MAKKLKYKIIRYIFDEEVFVEIKNNHTNRLKKISIFELGFKKKIISNLLAEDAFLIGYLLCECTVNLKSPSDP